MRRTTAGVAGVVAIVVLGLAGPAAAAAVAPDQDRPSTVWVQPGTEPLDGLGTFVYVAHPLPPGPTQGTNHYEYILSFHLQDGSFGLVAMGHKNGVKVVGVGITRHNVVDAVPYDWKYGQIYYLLTYRLSATQWGAWVYDWSATKWNLIAVQNVPETTGRMLPQSTTSVDYDAAPAPPPGADTTCAYYPRIDAMFTAPMGWRGDVITTATFNEHAGFDGFCPSSTVPVNGWQWTTLGQAAA